MHRLRKTAWVCVLATASLRAGGLEKVWELDLKKALQNENLGPKPSLKVEGLYVAPDNQQIAVALASGTFFFRIKEPNKALLRAQSTAPHGSVGWSPDGRFMHANNKVFHPDDYKSCNLSPSVLWPSFLGNDALLGVVLDTLAYEPGRKPQRPETAHIKFFDKDCNEQDDWKIPASWSFSDVSPDRGLISVTLLPIPKPVPPWTSLIVNPLTRAILRTESGMQTSAGRFAERGTTICSHTCRDVDTGATIAEASATEATIAVAADSSRLIVEDQKVKTRAIWDFRNGKRLVSWPLRFLTYSTTIDLDGLHRDRRPIPCTISPDGEYIAEGGDGKVWLYKVRP